MILQSKNIPKEVKILHPLYDSEIMETLKKDNVKPLGMYARNNLPDSIPKYAIYNMDNENGSGTHWMASFIDGKDFYYMDPLGFEPPQEIVNYCKSNNMDLYFCAEQIQPDKSIMCGYYSMYFLMMMRRKRYGVIDFCTLFDGKTDEKIKQIFWINKKIGLRGAGFDLVEKINKLFPYEFHFPGGYQFLGPGTKLENRIENLEELENGKYEDIERDIKYKTRPKNGVDQYASIHDLEYAWIDKNIKDKKEILKAKHRADEELGKKAYNYMKKGAHPMTTRAIAGLVAGTMYAKRKIGFGGDETKFDEIMKFLDRYYNKIPIDIRKHAEG